MDTFSLKLHNYDQPHEVKCVLLGEFRLRHQWASYVSQNNSVQNPVGLADAIRHYNEIQVASSFWYQTLIEDRATRIRGPSGQPSMGVRNPYSQAQKTKSYPLGAPGPYAPPPKSNRRNAHKGTGAAQPANADRNGTPRKAIKDKGSGKGKGLNRDAARNMGYNGPLVFADPNGKQSCFRGQSTGGCPRGNDCRMKDTHGICPLPACNKAKHICETVHSQIWADFARVCIRD